MSIRGKEMTRLHSSHPFPCLLAKEGADLKQRNWTRRKERVSQAPGPEQPWEYPLETSVNHTAPQQKGI